MTPFELSLKPQEMKKEASDIVYNLARSDNIIDIEYNPKLTDIIIDRTEGSLNTILNNFNRIAEQTDSPLITKEIKRAQRQYEALLKAKEEAELEAKKAIQEAKEAGKTTEQKITQNLFLQSVLSQDRKEILNFHHHIGIAAGTIEDHIKLLARKIRNGTIDNDTILSSLQKISYQAKLISSISRFATKANFNLKATEIKEDMIGFIKEHLLNVCSDFLKYSGDKLKIIFTQLSQEKCICKFKPIEITVILDNLLNNSKKAEATIFKVEANKIDSDTVSLIVSDNGKGILKQNISQIFDIGFTTTNGSGLGLCHVKDIVKSMRGSIELNKEKTDGTEFRIILKGRK